MLQDHATRLSELQSNAEAIHDLEGRLRLEVDEREALQSAVRLMKAIVANPQQAIGLLALLEEEEQRERRQALERNARIIWTRVDGIVHQAVKATYDLGRVNQSMIDGARTLGQVAMAEQGLLVDPLAASAALDRIEAASHALRAGTKALSGNTKSILKVDHAELENVLASWVSISSVDSLLACFRRLGFAWAAQPAPPVQNVAAARC